MFLCEHGDEGGSCAGVECAVRVQGGGAEEHEARAREEGREEREEEVGAWKPGGGERVEQMAACMSASVRNQVQGQTELGIGLMGQWPARLTLEKWSRVDDNHFERGRRVLRPHIPPRLEQHPLDDG